MEHLVWSQLTAGQWGALAVVWAVLFLLPAWWVRRHAARAESPVAHYWFWSTAVLLGPLGLYAYWMDRRVRQRKGELWPGER